MRPLIFVVLLSAALFAQAPPPQSQPQAPAGHSILSNPEKFADAHVSALDRAVKLTDEQRPKVRAIFVDEAKRLGKIMSDASITDAQRQNSIQSLHLATIHRVAAELTPEQREKYFQTQPPKPRPGVVQN